MAMMMSICIPFMYISSFSSIPLSTLDSPERSSVFEDKDKNNGDPKVRLLYPKPTTSPQIPG